MIYDKVKVGIRGFLSQTANSSEPIYLALLCVYLTTHFMLCVDWVGEYLFSIGDIRQILFTVILWGAAIYLFFIIVDWKKLLLKPWPLLITAVIMVASVIFIGNHLTENRASVILDAFFCIMACGKDYRRIVKCFFVIAIGTLLFAAIGWKAGISLETLKPQNVSPGRSFGIVYPNTWGYIAFDALLAAWYIWLRRSKGLSFVFFWLAAAFMYFVISCRTIAVLSALFPIVVLAMEHICKKPVVYPMRLFIVVFPVLFLALTLLLCWRMEWVHARFYGTPLHTMAMRFVQGGIAIKYDGIPLIGHPFQHFFQLENINGSVEKLYVMDSSIASYIILRGALWIVVVMLWLCFGNKKALKRGDYAILSICFSMMVFAMMERPGLDMWFNFVLLYPLAAIGDERI